MLRPRAPAFRFAPSHAHRATVPRRRRADLLYRPHDDGSDEVGSDSGVGGNRGDTLNHRSHARGHDDGGCGEHEDEVGRALRALAPRVRVPRLVNARTRRRANAFARHADEAVRKPLLVSEFAFLVLNCHTWVLRVISFNVSLLHVCTIHQFNTIC